MTSNPVKLGIIGAGSIAGAVIDQIDKGAAGNYLVSGVLARQPTIERGVKVPITTDAASFFSASYDLILELAGPAALRQHYQHALACCDVWSISGAALADHDLSLKIAGVASSHRHRLRLLSGAIAGIDCVATASVDKAARVHVQVTDTSLDSGEQPSYVGNAREACARFHGINVVAAVAIAGIGMDLTTVEYSDLRENHSRVFRVTAECGYAIFATSAQPLSNAHNSLRAVSASVVAALCRAQEPIWVG